MIVNVWLLPAQAMGLGKVGFYSDRGAIPKSMARAQLRTN
jgi:hypothetical protein